MGPAGRRRFGVWSTLLIAFAVTGTYIDALPLAIVLDSPNREECEDDLSNDSEEIVSGIESRGTIRIRPTPPSEVGIRRLRSMPAEGLKQSIRSRALAVEPARYLRILRLNC